MLIKANEFVSRLFELEVVAHIAHLQTTSYAEHVALKSLYEDIVELRDRFVESYQGKYGIITKYNSTISTREAVQMTTYIKTIAKEVESFSTSLNPSDGFLKQICDDICELLYSTNYKLYNLK